MSMTPEQDRSVPHFSGELECEVHYRMSENIILPRLSSARESLYTQMVVDAFQPTNGSNTHEKLRTNYLNNLSAANLETVHSLTASRRFGSDFSELQIAHATTRTLIQLEELRQLTLLDDVFNANVKHSIGDLTPIRKLGARSFQPIIDKPSTVFLAQKEPGTDASARLGAHLKRHVNDVAVQIDETYASSDGTIEDILAAVIEQDFTTILSVQLDAVTATARIASDSMQLWQDGSAYRITKHMASLLLAVSNGNQQL